MKNLKRLFIIGMCLVLICFAFGCQKGAPTVLEGQSKIVKCYIGENGTLTNADKYDYKSDNPDVIKIEGDSYTALTEGSASVTVTEKKGNGVAVLLFVVFGEKPIDIQSLKIDGVPSENSLSVADQINLSYQKTPQNSNNYDAIVWSSDNPEVISIDGAGNLIANKMGSATITVKALGTNVENKVTINVLPRETQFGLNYGAIAGLLGETEAVLTSTVRTDYPFDGKVEWFTEDESIVSVNNGELTYNKVGSTTVGITATINGAEFKATCNVKVVEDVGYTVIRTPEELQKIASASGNYMLGNDIDMAIACSKGGSCYNSGLGFIPLFENGANAFKGLFNGNGFAIKNLYINRVGEPFVAFMRYISSQEGSEGKIVNLALEKVDIRGANYTSVFYANAFGAGSTQSGLENCYASGSVNSVGSASALVGNNKGLVKDCVTTVSLQAIGKANIFALNHTIDSDKLGIVNCVYVGEATCELAELANGGFISNSFAITQSQVNDFDFSFLNTSYWFVQKGQVPVLKGV